MTHKSIFNSFKSRFPDIEEHSEIWFPNGKNSVRIRLKDGREIVYTCNDKDDWRLESLDSFIKRITN